MRINLVSDKNKLSLFIKPISSPIKTTGDYGVIDMEGDIAVFEDILEVALIIPASESHSLRSGIGTFNDLIVVLTKLNIPYQVDEPLPEYPNDRKIAPEFKDLIIV
jgi:hypothetical protein